MADTQQAPIGFLLVDKPAGMTSRTCINKLQKLLPKKTKIGHGGTLDAFATGLLIVGIGREATRKLSQLLKSDKQYQATATFGQETDTLDPNGTIIQQAPTEHITPELLEQALERFRGGYEQTPPAFSALKCGGMRLSDLARDQQHEEITKALEQKKRLVHVYDLNAHLVKHTEAAIMAHVSHGTYIRSLVADIGRACNSYATTTALRRIAIGQYHIDQATPLAQLDSLEAIEQALLPVTTL